MATFGPFGSAFECHGPPPVGTYMFMATEFNDKICTEKKGACKFSPVPMGKLYHRFKQNFPESESRRFDRLRLRLRLLACCHDWGRLRLRIPGNNGISMKTMRLLNFCHVVKLIKTNIPLLFSRHPVPIPSDPNPSRSGPLPDTQSSSSSYQPGNIGRPPVQLASCQHQPSQEQPRRQLQAAPRGTEGQISGGGKGYESDVNRVGIQLSHGA